MAAHASLLGGCLAITLVALAHAGDVIWDFGPQSGEYRGTWTNDTFDTNRAEEVRFDDFVDLTGIDIWTSISAPAGDMHIKILLDNGWGEPGQEYIRWDVHADRYQFDGSYSGVDLYKVSFDLAPIPLRAHTTYWIGVSGNGWELGQSTLNAPGNGYHARFQGFEYERMSSFGDQMFQLRGRVVAPPFELSLEGVCPGEMTASVIGATPGGEVAIIYGQCGGETTLPPGSPCPGAVLPVGEAAIINIVRADNEGSATLTGAVPDSVCGEICLVALDLTTCEVSAFAPTYRQPELYVGSQIIQPDGFADFNNESNYSGLEFFDEGGMHFRHVHSNRLFGGLEFCGGNGTSALYMGASHDMLSVLRVDGQPLGAIEFNPGDGWVDNCTLTYLWIRAYQDDLAIADYAIDAERWQIVGLKGGDFDEVRIGAYDSASSRDFAIEEQDETHLQALAIDDVRYGAAFPVQLTLTGACPGTMTADATGATLGGQVAFIRGTCDNQTTIPGGPCAGTVLPIGAPQIVATITADQTGAARITADLPALACGGRICLVALDLTTCGVSNPERVE